MTTTCRIYRYFVRARKSICFIITAIIGLMLIGCKAGIELEGGYTLPLIPIRIGIDSKGEIELSISKSFVTLIGTFDIGAKSTIYTIRQGNAGRLLMIRVDEEVTVYRLKEGEDFQVEFADDKSLYRKVSLEYDANGDIVLELESAGSRSSSSVGSHTSVSEVALCVRSDYDGTRCQSTRTVFSSNTEAVYVTWQSPDALAEQTEFTRRWYKDGRLLLENSNIAGENTRWTPSDGYSYFIYLSSTEGTGKRLFSSPSLPVGNYKLELFVAGRLSNVMEFKVQ